ncbi:MAG: type VI secretion system contractile sheath large subunit [Gammaproteobacteria bacterium]|nr:type VI secretion system contractile sheath large subunit [Gammaproteobacteria bacterium]
MCAQSAYVTSLQDFLAEKNLNKSLQYWIETFIPVTPDTSAETIRLRILNTIATIDELINDQLNEIIHQPAFQKLEASWRGLHYLTVQSYGIRNLKVRVLDVNWAEVSKDISRALEFDQSQLFQKIYSEEYDTPGGEPYGVIIGDYEIAHKASGTHKYEDLSVLEGLSHIAAASFAPFLTSAAPELFGLDDFATLGTPLNYEKIFSQDEYIKWRSFRERPDSRFVGLTLPHILMRRPYRTKPGSFKGLYFYEKCSDSDPSNYLWGNASYAFAGILIREYANVGWFGHIRGVPRNQIGGGLVTTLPVDTFATDAADIARKPVVDVIITDAVEKEISNMGFIPLCQCYDTPFAAFYNNQSIQIPKRMESRDATINAKLSAMLQHILCGSRIAHYIKVIIRDKVGSFITADECEDYLRNWLFRYTTGREDLDWEEQARYPLREAAVRVKEHPEKPGQFVCVIHLRPHYQLDNMVSELELVTVLAQSR